MATDNQDFSMQSGDDFVVSFTITEGGSPKDLTGVQAIKWACASSVIGSKLVEKSLGSGIAVTDAAGGVFSLTLVPADTASLEGDYYHEAELTDSSGKVSTVTTGTMTVSRDLV